MGFHDDGPAETSSQLPVATREVGKTYGWLRSLGTKRTVKVPATTTTVVDRPHCFVLTVAHITGHFRHVDRYGEIRISLHEVQKTKTTEPAIFMAVIQEKSLNMGFVAPV